MTDSIASAPAIGKDAETGKAGLPTASERVRVDLNLNRRAALGVLGTLGAAALSSSAAAPARAGGVEAGSFIKRPGVQGRMTGAQAAAASLAYQGVRCVFGVPGAQSNEFWDAMKARGIPYLLVTNEMSASVMADASARVTGEV